MVLLEFAMAPAAGASVSEYVARILDVIDKSGVPYQLTPMGTILEGRVRPGDGRGERLFRRAAADCSHRDEPEDGLPRRAGRAAEEQDRSRGGAPRA